MKQLLLIRHAKSDWADASLRDFDRPLNARGNRDAPRMAQYLIDQGVRPDLLVSSPANRAISTALHFAKVFDYPTDSIQLEQGLYEATSEQYLEVIRGVSNAYTHAAFFAHNPATSYLAGTLASEYISSIPTCGVARYESTAASWAEVAPENTKLLSLWIPKELP